MLRLQRYLLGELLAAFVLVLLIVTGIFLTGSLLQILQRFPEVSVFALLGGVPVFLGLALPVTIPLSFLMACLLTYGRFADDNEFLAFQMGGVSPRHAMAPAICAAAAVSVFTVALSCDVNPTLTSAKKSVLRGQIQEQMGRMRSPSATNVKLGDMEMSWSGRDGEWFLDSFLTWTTVEASKDGEQKVKKTNRVVAKRASVNLTDETPARLLVTLVDGKMPVDAGAGMTAFDAKEVRIYIDLGDAETDTKGKDEMRAAEIFYRMVRLEPLLGRSRQSAEWRQWRLFAGEYWRRVALGLSPLAFALFGVPLGLIVRRGSRAQALVLALFVGLPVYYPLLLWGENLARQDLVHPALALNIGNMVFGLAGTLMIRRICTR